MALSWNIEKCRDYKELTKDENRTLTDTLIWATMFVGIPTITENNAKEFYARLRLMELLNGTFVSQKGKAYYLTLEDVERRVGLTTNAISLTRAQFLKSKVNRYFDEIVLAK